MRWKSERVQQRFLGYDSRSRFSSDVAVAASSAPPVGVVPMAALQATTSAGRIRITFTPLPTTSAASTRHAVSASELDAHVDGAKLASLLVQIDHLYDKAPDNGHPHRLRPA